LAGSGKKSASGMAKGRGKKDKEDKPRGRGENGLTLQEKKQRRCQFVFHLFVNGKKKQKMGHRGAVTIKNGKEHDRPKKGGVTRAQPAVDGKSKQISSRNAKTTSLRKNVSKKGGIAAKTFKKAKIRRA